MKIRKITAWLILLTMVLTMLPTQVFADTTAVVRGICGENLTWVLDDAGTLTISGNGAMDDFNYQDAPWFFYRESVTNVTIERGVTAIGDYAFQHCYNLTSVTIPDSVTSIGMEAFVGCDKLISVTMPNHLPQIWGSAFYGTPYLDSIRDENGFAILNNTLIGYSGGEENVVIPEGVTKIVNHAFLNNSFITSVTIPDSVVSIGVAAFSGCYRLTNATIGDGVTTIGDYAFHNCNLDTVTFGDAVTSIGDYAFYGCYLPNLKIPDGVTSIGEYAFYHCGFSSITIPNSVTSIGDYAFGNCSNLASVTIPKHLTQIGGNAFEATPYQDSIRDANGMVIINGVIVDYNGDGESVVIPEGVTRIGNYAFANSDMTDITIPDSVTSIGDYAFDGCFYLTGVTIPNSVISIGEYAFYFCALTSVTIPDSVTSIGYHAFAGCTYLTSVTIGEGVTTIGERAFEAYSLTEINVSADNASYSSLDGVLFNKAMTELICAPTQISGDYVIPDSVISIGDYAFCGCANLTGVEIPDGVTTIGDSAFLECSNLYTIVIPDSVTSIGDCAFQYCSILTSVTIGDGVTRIGNGVFSDCYLTSVEIPDGVTSIGEYAFGRCGLTSVTIPDGVTWIGDWAFVGCGFTSVTIPDSVTSIGEYAFYGCNLSSITIPGSVAGIEKRAFAECYGLSQIAFLGDAPKFGDRVFEYITVTAYYPADNETWTTDVREDYLGTVTWKTLCQEHSFESQVSEATCINPGYEIHDCTVCGYHWESVTPIDPENHVGEVGTECECGEFVEESVPLKITKQPTNVTAANGESVKVTVEAKGEGLTYQWYYTSNGKTSAFYKSSNTTNTYTTTMDATRDGRKVYCVVTDKYGNSVKTDVVTLTMSKGTLKITKQPTNVTAANGESVKVSVEAKGDGLTYQWYYTSNGQSDKFFKSSNTTNTYTTTMDSTRDGRKIYCVITDQYGNSVKSNVATLRLGQRQLKITKQPENVTVDNATSVRVKVEAEGDGLTYQWYYTSNGSTSTFYKSSNTTDTYSVFLDESRDGRKVYCVVKDRYGDTVKSNVVTLSIAKQKVEIYEQPQDVYAGANDYVMVHVGAEGDGLTYQWYYTSNGKSSTFYKSSDTTDTYTTTMDATRDGRKIYCVITDQYGNSVKSNTVTLTLVEYVTIVTQPRDMTVAEGETVTVTLEAKGEGLTYAWFYIDEASPVYYYASSFTGNSYSTTMDATRDGRKVYCRVTDKYGSQVKSYEATLYMATGRLEIMSQPENVTTFRGQTAEVSVKVKGEGLTYQWYYTSNGNSSTFYKSSNTTHIYSTTIDPARDGRKVYCVITDKYGHTVKTDVVTLDMVKPVITKQPTDVTAANGEPVSVTVEANGNGLTYQWYYTSNGTTNVFYKSSNTTATYTTTMDATRNGRKVYCVVTDQEGNSVMSDVVTLSMANGITITKQPVNVTVANGETAKVSVEAKGEGLTYQWYYTSNGKTSTFYKSSNTTATYTTTMDATRDGRKVYCVITDKYGNSVKTDVVTLEMK